MDSPNTIQVCGTRKSDKIRRPSVWLKDYETEAEDLGQTDCQNLSATVIKSNAVGFPNSKGDGSAKPHSIGFPKSQQQDPNNTWLVGSDKSTRHPTSDRHRSIIFNLPRRNSIKICNISTTEQPEPTSVKEAFTSPFWMSAMKDEIKALEINSTWKLVPRQQWMNVDGSRWVFRVKQNSDGTLNRYKARLVAKGFHQKHGEDYDLTYSPIVKAATIRTILAISTSRQWKLHHVNVYNAFLNGNLIEIMYMEQPPGYTMKNTTAKSHVCRLQKAIYGLKQPPRAWYQRLKDFLHGCKFFNSTADSSLFIRRNDGKVIYVDDFVITQR